MRRINKIVKLVTKPSVETYTLLKCMASDTASNTMYAGIPSRGCWPEAEEVDWRRTTGGIALVCVHV